MIDGAVVAYGIENMPQDSPGLCLMHFAIFILLLDSYTFLKKPLTGNFNLLFPLLTFLLSE